MIDMQAADKFMNSLFDGIITHLDSMRSSVQSNLSYAAVQYAETNDGQWRITYLALKARLNTVKSMCLVISTDPGTGAITKQKINKMFPDLPAPIMPKPVVSPANDVQNKI